MSQTECGLARWRYTFLFAALLLMIAGGSVAMELHLSTPVTFGLTVLITVTSVAAIGVGERRVAIPLVLLFVLYNGLLIWQLVEGNRGIQIATQLTGFGFFALVTLRIGSEIFQRGEINRDHLAGAGSVYLLLGLMWSRIYVILELAWPGSFEFADHLTGDVAVNPAGIGEVLLYFSYVTLSTLGYGDVTPITEAARRLAMTEAIVGQLFIAITVARLVGVYAATVRTKGE